MNEEELNNKIQLLINEMRSRGFRVSGSMHKYSIDLKKNENDGYVVCRLLHDNSLSLIEEVYFDDQSILILDCDIKIDEPHYDNLARLVELYYDHGRGKNNDNPTLKELIDARASLTKSARNI